MAAVSVAAAIVVNFLTQGDSWELWPAQGIGVSVILAGAVLYAIMTFLFHFVRAPWQHARRLEAILTPPSLYDSRALRSIHDSATRMLEMMEQLPDEETANDWFVEHFHIVQTIGEEVSRLDRRRYPRIQLEHEHLFDLFKAWDRAGEHDTTPEALDIHLWSPIARSCQALATACEDVLRHEG